jgi:adenosylmethionine-8-amino-7-oxononanoate aminotransferase
VSNRDLVERSLRAVWHPCTQMKAHERFPLVPVARGSGAWLEDFDGRRFVDGVSSWWVNLFGHSHPGINAAIADQLGRLEHAMLAGFTHEPVVELAERLARAAPGRLGHAFFASDGASATEIAIKMACHHWANRGEGGKTRIVYLEGGYHGETLGALSVTDVALFRDAYAALLRRNYVTPFPAAHAGSREFQCENCAIEAAGALAKLLEDRAESVAAVILEPMVQGASGMRMYHPLFLRRARELCDRHRVLLIADEIMTGFGRTGTMFACEQAGVAPDLLCLSKGITGGYLPLSCVLSTDEVYGAFYDDSVARAFLHSHSYTGNPLACRAACAVLDIFAREGVIEANREKAARFDGLAAPLAGHPAVSHWRRLGMIWAFEVASADPAFARRAAAIAMENRALLRPIGNTVYFMPPYVAGEEEFAVLVEAGLAIARALGAPA